MNSALLLLAFATLVKFPPAEFTDLWWQPSTCSLPGVIGSHGTGGDFFSIVENGSSLRVMGGSKPSETVSGIRRSREIAQLRNVTPDVRQSGSIRILNGYEGTDLGARINSADLSLGPSQGEIWVRNSGTISTPVAISPKHILYFSPGTFYLGARIKLSPGSSLLGSGRGITILVATSTLTSVAVEMSSTAWARNVTLKGFTLNLTGAGKNAVGVTLDHMTAGEISDISIEGGAKGISATNLSASHIHDIYISDPTDVGIDYDADGGAEDFWRDIIIHTTSTRIAKGFFVHTSVIGLLGGIYVSNLLVTSNGTGSVVNGIYVSSTAREPTTIYGWFVNSVVDAANGGDSWYFSNVRDVRVRGCWGINASAARDNFAALHIDHGSNLFDVSGGHWLSKSRDISLTNAVTGISLRANQLVGTATNIYLDPTPGKADIFVDGNFAFGTLTNDPMQLARVGMVTVRSGGVTLAGHLDQVLGLHDTSGLLDVLIPARKASHRFAIPYKNTPSCTVSPLENPRDVRWWVTTSVSDVAVNLSRSASLKFSFMCVGNPD